MIHNFPENSIIPIRLFPKSRIKNPDSEIQDPKSRTRNDGFGIKGTKSRIQNPGSDRTSSYHAQDLFNEFELFNLGFWYGFPFKWIEFPLAILVKTLEPDTFR